MKQPKVSIIVPLFNHCEDLTIPFVRRLLRHSSRVDYELLLVNNGSSDATDEYIRDVAHKVKHVKAINLKKNLGFGGGNNAGYKKARGEYVCFISNDVMIEGRWLEPLIEACQKQEGLYGQDYYDFNTLTEFRGIPTPYLGGYLMFGTKKMFDSVEEDGEIFDSGFGTAYFEDVDLSVRCVNAGYPIKGLSYIPVRHLGSKSSDQINIPETTITAQRYFQSKMMRNYLERNKMKRIVFFTESSYPFIDPDYEGKGIGGSEASLVLLAREFALAGWLTEVYTTTPVAGRFRGVWYKNITDFRHWEYTDVFVQFRSPHFKLPYVNAVHKIFWSCDQYTAGYWPNDTFPYVQDIVAISPFHGNYIKTHYKTDSTVIELGINVDDYKDPLEKIDGKLLFCSVPHRGLKHLAYLFPAIKEKYPSAELYITSDYRLWGLDHPDNHKYMEEFLKIEGVHFLGMVPREELVYHQKSAELLIYPCEYEECFCISAIECIAAGAIPITTDLAALTTTVADSGILISNSPGHPQYDKMFVSSVVELLSNKDKASTLRKKGITRALSKYSFRRVFEDWMALITKFENSQNMVTCKVCNGEFRSSYILNRHFTAKHGDKTAIVDKEVVQIPHNLRPETAPNEPKKHIVTFKRSIEVQIGPHKFYGQTIEIPDDYVSEVVRIAREAYGPDILEL